MNLKEKSIYTNHITCLEVFISRIIKQDDDYIEFYGTISDKFSNKVYEVGGLYKISKSTIKNWFEVTTPSTQQSQS